jgi:hypothetical protein
MKMRKKFQNTGAKLGTEFNRIQQKSCLFLTCTLITVPEFAGYYRPLVHFVFRQAFYLARPSPEDIKRYRNSILPIKMNLMRKQQTELNEVLNYN